jgi:hypothetical protein
MPAHQCWLTLVRKEGGFDVGLTTEPPRLAVKLLADRVPLAAIPALLRDLNLCQTGVCQTVDGRTLRVRMLARERDFAIEAVEDGEQ